jgi:hypothetical protein
MIEEIGDYSWYFCSNIGDKYKAWIDMTDAQTELIYYKTQISEEIIRTVPISIEEIPYLIKALYRVMKLKKMI